MLVFVTVILAVSIVGIPLLVLVPVAVLALLVATLVGFAAVAAVARPLGEAQRFGWQLARARSCRSWSASPMIQGVTILARLIGLPGGFLGLFAFALIALGFFLKYAAWTMGLGAMTLSLLGRDWRRPGAGPESRGRIFLGAAEENRGRDRCAAAGSRRAERLGLPRATTPGAEASAPEATAVTAAKPPVPGAGRP